MAFRQHTTDDPRAGALVTKFALALDSLLTTKETKATLIETSDEPTPCASGNMSRETALGLCSRS